MPAQNYYAGAAGLASVFASGSVGNALANSGGGGGGGGTSAASGATGALGAAEAANPYGQAAQLGSQAIQSALGDSSTTSQTASQHQGSITFGGFNYAGQNAKATQGLTGTTLAWIFGAGSLAVLGIFYLLRRR